MNTEALLELLEGKVILKAGLKDDCLTITFTDNIILTSAARFVQGLDLGWDLRTEVAINGQKIIDK